MTDSAFPWYFLVDDRPLKVMPSADGGMDVLILDPDTGELKQDLAYLAYCFEPGQNVQRLSASEFETQVAQIRANLDRV